MKEQNESIDKKSTEFQELKQKYDALKALYELEIAGLKQAKKDALMQKKYLETILNTTVDGFWLVGIDGEIREVNESYCRMSGYTKGELKKMHINDINVAEVLACTKDHIQRIVDNGSDCFETRHRRKDGTFFDVEFSATYWNIEGGQFICFCRDITKRKQIEQQITILSHSVRQSPASILITDNKGRIEYVNFAFIRNSGYTLEEIIGKNPRILSSGHQTEKFYQRLWGTILSGKKWRGEIKNKRKNGELFWEYVLISPILNEQGEITHFVSVKEDITDRKRKDDTIRRNLKEKDILLAEIHHRVKNNLAVISSILELQMTFSELNEDPEKLLKSIKHRIKSMSIVHEMVYHRSDFSEINAGNLVKGLVDEISKVNRLPGTDITINVQTNDIMLDMNKSVPFSLLVNELITNAYKHAFHKRKKGTIDVRLEKTSKDFRLVIQDDGDGVPDFNLLESPKNFGYTIINGLIKQLRGKPVYSIPEEGGFKVIIRFANE